MDDHVPDPVLDALWTRVLDAWFDPKAHVALLEHAVRSESLPEIAGRYRALVSDPERGAIAQQRLDAIVAAAMRMLEATKAPPPAKVPASITLSAFGVCAVLLAWLAWAVWGHP
jgi:hypothetical protein